MNLLLMGTLGLGCSQPDADGASPQGPPDLGAAPDLGVAADLGLSERRELSLIAGAIGGRGNADGIGTTARFSAPNAMVSDGKGGMFVADTSNNLIRKVDLTTGAVETLAGGPGTVGHSDGVGAAASFYIPSAIAFDGVGLLYVADANNNLIRKVEVATGAVTTLAGSLGGPGYKDGIGAAAGFYSPAGLALDGAGNLYVADTYNHMIRKVVLATAAVTTIAGAIRLRGSDDGIGLSARFDSPAMLAYDGAGSLFIPDAGNHTIRKMVLATGAVTTVAGLATMSGSADGIGTAARFMWPEAVVFDGAGNLFISEVRNHTVRKLSLATGEVTTLCGGPRMSGSADGPGNLARFNEPLGVALDGLGNLFIADSQNATIRKLDLASRMVTTPLGATQKTGVVDGTGAAARFFVPRAAVVDGAGNLYVADTQNYTIRKVVLSSGEVSTIAGTPFMSGANDGGGPVAHFSGIRGLALDGAGKLYVADTGNHTIRTVELATGQVTTLAGHPASSGSVDGVGDAARFYDPRGLAFDGAGNLYVADTANHTIRKIAVATAAVTTLAGRATVYGTDDGVGDAARFENPSGLAFDGAGNLYLTDLTFNTIRKIELESATVKTLAGQASLDIGSNDGVGAAARFNHPEGLTVDAAGNVYIADTGNSLVRRLDPTSGLVTTIAGVRGRFGVKLGSTPGLNHPPAVVALPSGALVILDESAVLLAR